METRTYRDELVRRATDPRQYDDSGMDWAVQGTAETPSARFDRDAVRAALQGLRIVAALDIGCGTGHLTPLLRSFGAERVVGLEPSARNAAIARKSQPGLEVVETPLAALALPSSFDVAVAVMSFEHQPDLDAAFRAVHGVLRAGGRFVLITGDPEFHRTPRFGLGLEIHPLTDGSEVVATRYPFGTIHDLIRPPDHYLAAARRTGFELERHDPMPPTPELIESDPRWGELAHLAIGHRFRFRKP